MHYLTVGKLIEELQKYKSSLMVVDTRHDNGSNLISASDIKLVTVKWSNDYKSLI